MRLFLAVNLPPEVRRALTRATETLRAAAPDLAWVGEPLIHLTLKFLGDQPPEMVERLQGTIAAVSGRHRELVINLHAVGAFPNFRRARIVWLGIEPDGRLELLHHDLEMTCEGLGFEVDGRPFRPHLTLARVRKPLDAPVARTLARTAKGVDFRSEFVVRSIELMRSELSSAGPSYTTLVSAPLRSG